MNRLWALFDQIWVRIRRLVDKVLPFFLSNFPSEVAEDLARHIVFSAMTSLWNVSYDQDISGEAKKLSAEIPVLCIHSDDDDRVPFVNVDDLLRRKVNRTLYTLNGVRHYPWLWATRACVKVIDEFLASINPAERGEAGAHATGSSAAVPSV